jgi:hypothetical protein
MTSFHGTLHRGPLGHLPHPNLHLSVFRLDIYGLNR